jgi:tRNA (guanosine-2'-O-)-methyltransferase
MDSNLSYANKKLLLNHLLGFASENKSMLFDKVIQYRTRYITVVLEDIFQSHNASAVLRSCDCFGIQDVHIIENYNKFEVNHDIALGSAKWLDLYKYCSNGTNTINAYESLKAQGYRIIATTPHKNDYKLTDLSLDSKVALVFGTELNGLSDEAIKHADAYVKIPMYGFTESFNISVSAAIILHYLTEKLRDSSLNWKLNEEEIVDIKLRWVKNVVKSSDLIEKRLFKNL